MRLRPISFLFVSTVLFAMLAPAAKADTLDFSFSFSSPAGTVTGEIVGLADNGTSSATAIYIDTASNNYGNNTLPYDILSSYATVGHNTFTVSGGAITAADVYVLTGFGDPTEPSFNNFELNSNGGINALTFSHAAIANSDGLAGVSFEPLTASATPEPAASTYMLESFGVGACFAWRRLRRVR